MNYLWLISHGYWLATSAMGGVPALSDAGAYILYAIAPFYRMAGVWGILWLQTLSLLIGLAYVLKWAKEDHAAPLWRPVLVILYVLFPAVWGPYLFDFHPDVLAIPILSAMIDALWRKKWRTFWICFGLALLIKDTMVVALTGMALTLWHRGERRRAIIALFLTIGFTGLSMFWLMPALASAVIHHHNGLSQWAVSYGWMGQTPLLGIKNLITHPQILSNGFTRFSWFYIVALLGPLMFLFVLSWNTGILWPAFTVILFNAVSHLLIQSVPWYQYSVFVVPFLMRGQTYASALIPQRWAKDVMLIAVLFAIVFNYNELHLASRAIWEPQVQVATLNAAARVIPKYSPVIAQNRTLDKFANRPSIRLLSPQFTTASNGTYLLVENENASNLPSPQSVPTSQIEHTLQRSQTWHQIFHRGRVSVYVKQ